MKPPPKPAKHLPADERRAATVAALVALAAERNPGEITTTEIAARMGLTQGALFRHFPTKDAILGAVMQWVADQFIARIEAPTKNIPSALAAMEKVFLAHARFVSAHPGVPRMIFGELQRGKPSAAREAVGALLLRYRGLLRRLIQRGKADGELPAALDTEAAITLFIGMIQGLVMQSLLAGDATRIRRMAPKVFAIYQRGIRSAL